MTLVAACSAGAPDLARDAGTAESDGGAVGASAHDSHDSGGSDQATGATALDGAASGTDAPLGDGGADGAPDVDADAGVACLFTLPPGTYAVHYSMATSAGPPCPPLPPDTTFTVPGPGGPLPPGVACTTTTDPNSCTTTTDCTSSGGGLVVLSHTVTLLHPDGTGSGSAVATTTLDGVTTACPALSFAYTKQ